MYNNNSNGYNPKYQNMTTREILEDLFSGYDDDLEPINPINTPTYPNNINQSNQKINSTLLFNNQ